LLKRTAQSRIRAGENFRTDRRPAATTEAAPRDRRAPTKGQTAMTRSHAHVPAALAAAALASAAAAQSFNIDFTRDGAAPPDAYAAAGLAGRWNAVDPPNFGASVPLVGLGGETTSATIVNLGGADLLTKATPATGDDDALLSDYLVTYDAGLESCIFFNGLEPGTYEVTIYAWTPDDEAVESLATVDEAPGVEHLVGGAWDGELTHGVTHATFTAEVGDNGLLRTHSGIAMGADPALGAAFNGIQIRLLGGCLADLDADGAVGSGDLGALLAAWGACPLSAACPANLDGDGDVDSADLGVMLAAWGACD